MAVLTFERIHNGRARNTTVSGKKQITRYTDIYRATTDSNTTEPETVVAHADCPDIGDAHARDADAYCRSVRAVNEPFSKKVFLVTVGFSTEYEMAEDPTDEPARISWRTESYQKPVVFDRNAVAHLNTAGDLFDPPAMMDDSRWVATIVKNVSTVASLTWLLSYRDAINSAQFTLDGLTIPKGWAKLSAIEISEPQERNTVAYRVLTMTIQMAELEDTTGMIKWVAGGSGSGTGGYVALGASEFEHAHATITLNAGLKQTIGGGAGSGLGSGSGTGTGIEKIDCVDSDMNPASAPMLLDIDGSQIGYDATGSDPVFDPPDPDEALFVVSDVYREKNFGVLPLT